MAKAVGYYYQRFTLDLSSNGYVQGAGYTDVHARLPAHHTSVLDLASRCRDPPREHPRPRLAASRARSGALGLRGGGGRSDLPGYRPGAEGEPGAEHARAAVHPAQHRATQAAYNLTPSNVTQEQYPATQSLTPAEEKSDEATFNDIRLWDPEPSLTGATYTKQQQERVVLPIHDAGARPLHVNGKLTPTIVAVRQVNSSNLPAQGWVNTHLEYTHGYGMIVSPANTATTSGLPRFDPGIENVPPQSVRAAHDNSQPDVYFGVNNPGYVIADTKQPEIDYQQPPGRHGQNVDSTYRAQAAYNSTRS